MRGATGPVVKDVVLVGAGHAHVQLLRRSGMRPIPGVRFTLISRALHTPYSGMLPGLVAGLYDFDEAHIDTGPLTRFAAARLYADEVIGLDLGSRRVLCRHRPPVPYDLLSINIGSRPNTGEVQGAEAHAIPVKPIDGFLARFEALKARVLAGRSRHVLLVGGGAGGVELLLSVERRLRREVAQAGPGHQEPGRQAPGHAPTAVDDPGPADLRYPDAVCRGGRFEQVGDAVGAFIQSQHGRVR